MNGRPAALLDLLLRQRVVIVAGARGHRRARLALSLRRGGRHAAAMGGMDRAMAMPPKGAVDLSCCSRCGGS